MRSATSFFNPALSKSLLRRFWPLIGGYGLIWALMLPLRQLSQFNGAGAYAPNGNNYWYALADELRVCVKGGQIMAFCFGILFAMAMFSYLTNPRATGGMHALPLRRETHYWTAYLTGLGAMLAVELVTLLLSLAVLALSGFGRAAYLGWGLVGMALPTVWFYSFGVLCMIFTGQILAAPVFYGILGILPVGVETLLSQLAGNFLYGWGGYHGSGWTTTLSPIVRMLASVDAAAPLRAGTQSVYGLTVESWEYLVIYTAAGIVLAVLSLPVYEHRGSEETGTTVAVRWARPIFQYGVTFCAALALGQIFYELLLSRNSVNGSFSRPGILLCMGAAGLIGFFAAEMLLKKSVRITKKGWRNAAIVTAVMLAVGFGMTQDLTGYEGYQPRAEEIGSVTVNMSTNYSGSFSVTATDAETIRLAMDAHRAIIDDKARQQAQSGDYDYSDESIARVWFRVVYALRDGRLVTRDYDRLVVCRGELGDADSLASRLNAFYNANGVVRERVLGTRSGEAAAIYDGRATITGGRMETANDEGVYVQYELDAQQAERIVRAIQSDIAAGRGNQSLFGYRFTASDSTYLMLYGLCPDESGRMTSLYLEPVIDEGMSETIATLAAIRALAASGAALSSSSLPLG